MANNGPIKKYKLITAVATAADIATLPDSYKTAGMEIFVEDEQVTYSYNPETGTFPAPTTSSSSFVKIATLTNVNLATVGVTSFVYEDGITSLNSSPTNFIAKRVNGTDTYNSNGDTQNATVKVGSTVLASINPFTGAFALTTTAGISNTSALNANGVLGNIVLDIDTAAGAQFLLNLEIWGIKIS